MESELNKAKLTLAAIDQLKADLAPAKQAQDASFVAETLAQNEVAATRSWPKRNRHFKISSSFKW